MEIIHWPHPTLLRVSKPLKRVDAELKEMVREMFALMYANRGVGLAANQVDLPYRLFVVNESGDGKQPDKEMVFINPVLTRPKGTAEDEEGCLSLPGLYAPVRRPDQVHVNAYSLAGEELNFVATGHFARILQHENDHLDGILFIDRLAPTLQLEVREELEGFANEFQQLRERGEIPGDAAITERWNALEAART